MRVGFLSLTHRFDDPRVLYKEARTLAAAGYEVTHVAPSSHPLAPFVVEGVRVHQYRWAGGLVGRAQRFARLVRAAWRLRFDVVHCNELESWGAGWLIKLLRPSTVLVFDVHEHYPSRYDDSGLPAPLVRAIGGFVRLYIRALLGRTDQLIFAKRTVAADYARGRCPQALVRNFAPLWLQEEAQRAEAPTGPPTAVHIGGFSRNTGWPELLEALRLVRCEALRAVVVGHVVEGAEELWARARALGVDHRLTVVAHVPYEEVFRHLREARIGLMLYQPGVQNHAFAFPMKMYDYMLAGLPLIAPAFALEVAPIVTEHRCGICVDTGSPQAIADALDWLCEHPEEASAMGWRGREAVLSSYNWEHESGQLLSVYARLVGVVDGRLVPSREATA